MFEKLGECVNHSGELNCGSRPCNDETFLRYRLALRQEGAGAGSESGLHQQIESIVCLPLEADAIVHQINPLGRVPALVTAEGWLLVDSPVICEYLDSLRSSGLYPTGQARWRALRWQALGDGVMDSAVPWRQERIFAPKPNARPSGCNAAKPR